MYFGGEEEVQMVYQETVPDRSKSDYYCKVCCTSMNSLQIWQNHIAGKRHLKNMKKVAGEGPSQVKNIKLEGERATIQDFLDKCDGPLVGLSYIVERLAPIKGGENLYHCHLCQGSLTRMTIVEHVMTFRHKLMFFRHIKSDVAASLDNMKHLSKPAMDVILSEAAGEHELRHGRELVQVELRKPVDWKKPARSLYYPASESWSRPRSSSSLTASRDKSPPRAAENLGAEAPPVPEEPPTMSSLLKRVKRFSIDQKLELCMNLANNMKCDTVPELHKAFEVYEAASKLYLLPKLRALPKELFDQLYKDVVENPPLVKDVVDEILKGKKSHYFVTPPNT